VTTIYNFPFAFDSVIVLESLAPPSDPLLTGKRLYDDVLKPWADREDGNVAVYRSLLTKADFFDGLSQVVGAAQQGHAPILQIEAHGDRDGLGLASKEFIRWEELAPELAAANEACRFNLLVVSSACFGIYLQKALLPTSRSPAWGIIGPDVRQDDTVIDDFNHAFYNVLLSTYNVREALNIANGCQPYREWLFGILPADLLFCRVFAYYMKERGAREKDIVKVREIIAAYAKATGTAPDVTTEELLLASFQDHRSWYDALRDHFLMLDLYPTNSGRFPLSYDDCLTAHSLTTVSGLLPAEAKRDPR